MSHLRPSGFGAQGHTLTIAGLQWRHHGPSFYELAGFPQIEVAYLGDGSPEQGPQWFLFLAHESGAIDIREFASRDEACRMVAEAFNVQ